jgi:hypothetical protein
MKNILSILLVLALTIGFASAGVPICATVETTYVAGIVTYESNPVDGAAVDVTCNGHVQSTTSAADGSYSVQYPASECSDGDSVSVSASKDSLNGNSDTVTWSTSDTQIGCLRLIVNVACADVPLIPEFTVVLGTLTAISAVAVFFVVRRR